VGATGSQKHDQIVDHLAQPAEVCRSIAVPRSEQDGDMVMKEGMRERRKRNLRETNDG
jgi:hypothetical protein